MLIDSVCCMHRVDKSTRHLHSAETRTVLLWMENQIKEARCIQIVVLLEATSDVLDLMFMNIPTHTGHQYSSQHKQVFVKIQTGPAVRDLGILGS